MSRRCAQVSPLQVQAHPWGRLHWKHKWVHFTRYSCHPKTGPWMVIFQTQFVSGFWMVGTILFPVLFLNGSTSLHHFSWIFIPFSYINRSSLVGLAGKRHRNRIVKAIWKPDQKLDHRNWLLVQRIFFRCKQSIKLLFNVWCVLHVFSIPSFIHNCAI